MTAERDGRDRFGRLLVLGAGIAIALPASVMLAAPLLGPRSAVALHGLLAAGVWAYALASTRRRGLAAGVFALLLGGLLLLATGAAHASGSAPLAGVLAVALAMARGVVLGIGAGARRVAVELAIGSAAVACAALAGTASLPAAMASLWSFFLVQAAHPLLLGREGGRRGRAGRDPFERAASRLEALLDDA